MVQVQLLLQSECVESRLYRAPWPFPPWLEGAVLLLESAKSCSQFPLKGGALGSESSRMPHLLIEVSTGLALQQGEGYPRA
jgi:hypothetical protein